MKTLINKTVKVGKKDTTYLELCETSLKNPPKDGFDFEEIRKRNKIQDKLDTSDGKIVLEDAEAEDLNKCVKAMRWLVMDKSVLEFGDDVENMK